jgi:hypothetical protein
MPKPAPGSGFRTISHPKKRAILIAYAESGHVGNACANARITPRMHQYWLKEDLEYAAAFEEARAMAAQALEDEARRRAVICESDVLLIFLLKGAMPERYRDNVRHEHTGSVTYHEQALSDVSAKKEALRHANGHAT